MEIKLMEIFYEMSAFYGKSIRVVFLTRLRQGHYGTFMESDIYMFLDGKYRIFLYPFSLYVDQHFPPPSLFSIDLPSSSHLTTSSKLLPHMACF
jgi:hypothetical protein